MGERYTPAVRRELGKAPVHVVGSDIASMKEVSNSFSTVVFRN
ncbi:hypothetical protein [Pendulispora rubella]